MAACGLAAAMSLSAGRSSSRRRCSNNSGKALDDRSGRDLRANGALAQLLCLLDERVGLGEAPTEQRKLGLVDGHVPARRRQPELPRKPRGDGELVASRGGSPQRHEQLETE
jgi:hypothetical protein